MCPSATLIGDEDRLHKRGDQVPQEAAEAFGAPAHDGDRQIPDRRCQAIAGPRRLSATCRRMAHYFPDGCRDDHRHGDCAARRYLPVMESAMTALPIHEFGDEIEVIASRGEPTIVVVPAAVWRR